MFQGAIWVREIVFGAVEHKAMAQQHHSQALASALGIIRLLVTIAAMTVQGALAEPQMRMTIRHAIEAGATPREIAEVIYQMGMFGGIPAMQKALEIAQGVFTESEGDTPA